MKQIEEYVNKAYRNVKGNEKEIQELKSEMKTHLIEAVHELKSEGKTEQEAIKIAIDRFGKENELRSIISQLFQTQKAFGKRLLYIGLGILMISTIIFGFTMYIGNEHESEQATIAYEVADIVSNNEEIPQTTEEEIENLLKDADYISKVNVYETTNLNGESNYTSTEPIHEYEREVSFPSTLFINSYGYGTDDNYVELEIADYRILAIIILFAGLTGFGLLLTIWAIINAYHKRRPNVL